MKWTNHIDITDNALKGIFPLEIREYVCKLVVQVDKKATNIPHHSRALLGEVMTLVKRAREHYLDGREFSAILDLSTAIHYIQDLCVSYCYGAFTGRSASKAEEELAIYSVSSVGATERYADDRLKEYDTRYSKQFYHKYPINHIDRPYTFLEQAIKDELKDLKENRFRDPAEAVKSAYFLTKLVAMLVFQKPKDEMIDRYSRMLKDLEVGRMMATIALIAVFTPLIIIFRDFVNTLSILAFILWWGIPIFGWVSVAFGRLPSAIYSIFLVNFIISILKMINLIPDFIPTIPNEPIYTIFLASILAAAIIPKLVPTARIYRDAEWYSHYISEGREDLLEEVRDVMKRWREWEREVAEKRAKFVRREERKVEVKEKKPYIPKPTVKPAKPEVKVKEHKPPSKAEEMIFEEPELRDIYPSPKARVELRSEVRDELSRLVSSVRGSMSSIPDEARERLVEEVVMSMLSRACAYYLIKIGDTSWSGLLEVKRLPKNIQEEVLDIVRRYFKPDPKWGMVFKFRRGFTIYYTKGGWLSTLDLALIDLINDRAKEYIKRLEKLMGRYGGILPRKGEST